MTNYSRRGHTQGVLKFGEGRYDYTLHLCVFWFFLWTVPRSPVCLQTWCVAKNNIEFLPLLCLPPWVLGLKACSDMGFCDAGSWVRVGYYCPGNVTGFLREGFTLWRSFRCSIFACLSSKCYSRATLYACGVPECSSFPRETNPRESQREGACTSAFMRGAGEREWGSFLGFPALWLSLY